MSMTVKKRGRLMMKKMTPLSKMSKKAQKAYHAKRRLDWNGVKPVTRVIKSRKVYDRKKLDKSYDTEE